jgi:tetratricopeptide (TPR) repeat protein
MSLINDVLNELEKNKKSTPKQHEALAGMVPTIKKQEGETRWKFVYWLIILAIVLSVAWHYRPSFVVNIPKTIASLQKNKLLASMAPKPQAPIIPQPPKVKLQNIVLEQKDNKNVLDFILSEPTQYYIEHNSEQQFFITLSDTGVSGNLPISIDNTLITAFNTKQNNNNIVSTITLLPGTKIEVLQLVNTPPHLHLVLSNPQLIKASLSKIPTLLSPEEQATESYHEIEQLLMQNKNQAASQKLHIFIGDFPSHNQARLTLVTLLIKEGRLQKADDILMVGLNKYGDYSPFIKLKAHILVKQNRVAAAIELLQNNLANNNDDVEYLALLAALYQQQGAFMPAAELYNQLTRIQPQKASWWLGLGIALESANKRNAAKEAYQRAYDSSDISPELSAFLDNKVR